MKKVKGRNPWEHGLVHRLDYDTSGLVLVARNDQAFESLSNQEIKKGYRVYSTQHKMESMHIPKGWDTLQWKDIIQGTQLYEIFKNNKKFEVESRFRPYGPKRMQVKPVFLNNGHKKSVTREIYRTQGNVIKVYNQDIIEASLGEEQPLNIFESNVQITKGFRHQIRCHMSSIGLPILNDPLYGTPKKASTGSYMGLQAISLTFKHPKDNQITHIEDTPYPVESILLK